MGKRRQYRFPQGINGVDRYHYPRRQMSPDNTPTNYVTELFGSNEADYNTDILGSYTGVPKDGTIVPTQDADDL